MIMVERAIERFLFASRWLLAPFFILLVGGLLALLIKAIQHTWVFASDLLKASESAVIVDVLGYIDLTLTALLIVIVILAGYESFVSRFAVISEDSRPAWLTRIDFTGLKLRLLSSLVAISAIQLLRVFLDIDETSNRDLAWSVGVHLTFVASAVLLAATDRLTDARRNRSSSS
jgi:uncharacterized protein (TIGR00645 family)